MTEAIPAAESRACSNCGAALSSVFCSRCGQEDREVRRPFWRIFGQFIRAVFDLDGRVYRSLFYLFTRPGFLSGEYINGRRACYTPPLRMFLALSISFFLMVSILPRGDENFLAGELPPEGQASNQPLRDLLADEEGADELDIDLGEVRTAMEAVRIPFLPQATGERLKERLIAQTVSNYNQMRDNPQGFFRDFFRDSLEYVTIFILLMMPLLALLQMVLYLFRRRYYVEHFILTLHNHSFLIVCAFLLSVTGLLAGWTPLIATVFEWLDLAIVLWAIAYLYLSLRNYYGGGYFFSGFVFIFASIIYGALMLAGFMIFLVVAFLMY